jgi:hypothetical protein
MPRIVLTLAEWRSVAYELAGVHNAIAPAGLHERIQALVAQAPQGWSDEPFALELDESGMEAVGIAHAALTQGDPHAQQRTASLSAAVQIIHDHQHRS